MERARTVLGDVPAAELGVVDAHDHLFFASPALAGEERHAVAAATAELRAFRDAGGATLVQWTPHGLSRHAAELPGISRAASVHLIAATGLHQARHYPPELLAGLRGQLAEVFVAELTRGVRDTGVRAGLIKVAGGFHGLDDHARWVLDAAAHAHHETGAPIGVHLELGTAGERVADLLCRQLGVPPHAVVLGHLHRDPDLRALLDLAATGTFLGFEGPSRANHATDWRLLDVLVGLAEAGHAGQLLLGGDNAVASMRAATGGGPGIPHLLTTLAPRLARELGQDTVTDVLVSNPARAFAVTWRA